MTNISRRHLFKTATAAGLAVGIPATQKAQAQVSDIRKIPKDSERIHGRHPEQDGV